MGARVFGVAGLAGAGLIALAFWAMGRRRGRQ